MLQPIGRKGLLAVSLMLMFGLSTGCAISNHRGTWPTAGMTRPDPSIPWDEHSVRLGSLDLAKAELAFAAAHESMSKGEERCVDEFYSAARHAWNDLEPILCQRTIYQSRANKIYTSSLNAIITEGQRTKRLDPLHGLKVRTATGWNRVPIHYNGFTRQANEFNYLITVGDYSTRYLNRSFRRCGLGVPTVAMRCGNGNNRFQRDQQAFAATLVLRPKTTTDSGASEDTLVSEDNDSFVLELHDPLRTSNLVVLDRSLPLAHDSTAPIAYELTTSSRNYAEYFLRPGLVTPEDDGLFMTEPYQPGKIPVVFVHGLLSDRLTWANLVNEINARPELMRRYQLWKFEYPTGEPFLRTAALLRRQLRESRMLFDPDMTDTAFEKTVLIGHSMGGLISKLQVIESGDRMWRAISNRGFEDVVLRPRTRTRLEEYFFFQPAPTVGRVVFIGTPHRGSAIAQRIVGRIGSSLIQPADELRAEHAEIIRDNPETFSGEFSRRIPTSIDMLDPNSPLLRAMEKTSIESSVTVHSIIGRGRWMLGQGDSDGVVPVSSARHVNAATEKFVDYEHSRLMEDPGTVEEVLSILVQHCREANMVESNSRY